MNLENPRTGAFICFACSKQHRWWVSCDTCGEPLCDKCKKKHNDACYKSSFWQSVKAAAKEVATWPEWKKAGVIAKRETK